MEAERIGPNFANGLFPELWLLHVICFLNPMGMTTERIGPNFAGQEQMEWPSQGEGGSLPTPLFSPVSSLNKSVPYWHCNLFDTVHGQNLAEVSRHRAKKQ